MYNLPRLIGITGAAGAGKDTLGSYLGTRYGYVRRALADPIKEILNARFGWTMGQWQDRGWKESPNIQCGYWAHPFDGFEDMPHSPRTWAQWYGTDAGRAVHGEDCWVKILFNNWRHAGKPLTVVTDVRFDNEAHAIRRAGGLILHVVRPGVTPVNPHPSEAGIVRCQGDIVVYNHGDLIDMYEGIERELLRSPRGNV
jgi:hypothetical protein